MSFNKAFRIIRISLILIFLIGGISYSHAESVADLDKTAILGQEYYVYVAKKNESVYGIAKRFGWDLEELLKINPETANKINKGTILYYPTGNLVAENNQLNYRKGEPIIHTVKKGENVYSISRLYEVPLEIIYSANPWAKKGVNQGEELIILTDSTNYNIAINTANNRNHLDGNRKIEEPYLNSGDSEKFITTEQSFSEDGEFYSETFEETNDSIADEIQIIEDRVKIALLLDEPSSKKDIDFTRGFLVALSSMKESPFKIDFKVLDGRNSSQTIEEELDSYSPSIIITTADKVFPLFLADYGNSNDVKVVNVFDIKTELFKDNASIIQLLQPSVYFNDLVSSGLYRENSNRKLIVVGELDENDGIASRLIEQFDGNSKIISLEEFGSLEPDLMESYIIYSFANKKEEIFDFFNNVENLYETYPGLNFKVVGRTNWIAMTDDLGDKFQEYSVEIPSRVWINEDSQEWKDFTATYMELFDGYPVRSIPNFAASGYDIANYFIPKVAKEKGLTNKFISGPTNPNLQNSFRLEKVNDQGGLLNGVGYIIRFTPGGKEKIKLEK